MNGCSYNIGMHYSKDEINKMYILLSSMADKTRIKILSSLLEGEKCVCEISKELDISQSLASHQLATLKKHFLVKSYKRGQHRFYSLDDEHVELILKIVHEHILEENHD